MEKDNQCGLDFKRVKLWVNDTKHFGPEKYVTDKATVYCNIETCPLSTGVNLSITPMKGETIEEIQEFYKAVITTPTTTEYLSSFRVKNCPLFKKMFEE